MNRLHLIYRSVILCTLFALTLLLSASTTVAQQKQCYVGLEYQMSYNNNWGANRPVILTVYPGSPADKAGLKAGDIIESIAGQDTERLTEEAFQQLLQTSSSVELKVSNFAYHRENRSLLPECLSREAMPERMLARAFGMYSLEDESDILVAYPFETGVEGKLDLINYATFAYAKSNSPRSELDRQIEAQVSTALEAKGLRYDTNTPDLIVDVYYTVTENPYYDATLAKRSEQKTSYRIDPGRHTMVELPILPIGADKLQAKYNLKFGITIYNAHNAKEMLWTSEAKEMLSDDYALADYTALTAPIMLMQFPFARYFGQTVVRFSTHRHLAMGINYRTNDISLVHSTSVGSPADQAGIKAGDQIIAINGLTLGTARELSEAYLSFIKKSMQYRARDFYFTIKDGPKNCRYWKAEDYSRVSRLLSKDKYRAGFSYLFAFNPWITSEPTNTFTVDLLREGVLQRLSVQPKLSEACYISIE